MTCIGLGLTDREKREMVHNPPPKAMVEENGGAAK
jgi:hypothetical protein